MRVFFFTFLCQGLGFAVCSFLPGACSATPQIPDALEYKGSNYEIGVWFDGLVLEDYFRAGHKRPDVLKGTSSGCWRGYVACWRVAGDKLWLTEVLICTNYSAEEYGFEQTSRYRFPLARIFGTEAPAVEATWFSGAIELGRKLVETRPVAEGEQLKYEGTVLVFDKGKLLREERRALTVLKRPEGAPLQGLPLRSRLGPPPLEPVKK
jgi:hypothetical protein